MCVREREKEMILHYFYCCVGSGTGQLGLGALGRPSGLGGGGMLGLRSGLPATNAPSTAPLVGVGTSPFTLQLPPLGKRKK